MVVAWNHSLLRLFENTGKQTSNKTTNTAPQTKHNLSIQQRNSTKMTMKLQNWLCGKPISKKWECHGVKSRCNARLCLDDCNKTCVKPHTSSSANATQLPCTTIEFAHKRHFKVQTLRYITSRVWLQNQHDANCAHNKIAKQSRDLQHFIKLLLCKHTSPTLTHRLGIATHIKTVLRVQNANCAVAWKTIRKQ